MELPLHEIRKGRDVKAWSRWRQLAPKTRWLALEAGLALLNAKLTLALRPFPIAVASSSFRLAQMRDNASELELAEIVRAVATRLWWRSVCFDQGLALQAMCRRRGIDARLNYGIGKAGDYSLAAHVWVTVNDKVALGGDEAAHFRCVAVYPDETGE